MKNYVVEIEWSFKSIYEWHLHSFLFLAPFNYRMPAMRCLFYRAKLISSDHLYIVKATDQIIQIFLKNCFPKDLISKIKHHVEQKLVSFGNISLCTFKVVKKFCPIR